MLVPFSCAGLVFGAGAIVAMLDLQKFARQVAIHDAKVLTTEARRAQRTQRKHTGHEKKERLLQSPSLCPQCLCGLIPGITDSFCQSLLVIGGERPAIAALCWGITL